MPMITIRPTSILLDDVVYTPNGLALIESNFPENGATGKWFARVRSSESNGVVFLDLWRALRTRCAEHKRNVHRSTREAITSEVLRGVVDLRRKGVNRLSRTQSRSRSVVPKASWRRFMGPNGNPQSDRMYPAESAPELQFA
jgi:hypothetical protein